MEPQNSRHGGSVSHAGAVFQKHNSGMHVIIIIVVLRLSSEWALNRIQCVLHSTYVSIDWTSYYCTLFKTCPHGDHFIVNKLILAPTGPVLKMLLSGSSLLPFSKQGEKTKPAKRSTTVKPFKKQLHYAQKVPGNGSGTPETGNRPNAVASIPIRLRGMDPVCV